MKTTSYTTPILFAFFFSLLTMNVTAISQTVQWQTIFGNPGNQFADIGYNCIQSIDGTFLVTGRWEIPVPEWPYTRVKAFVSRLDTSGSVMWTKLIGDSTEFNEAFSLAEDPQRNIYVAYWNGYAHLAKLNPDGDMIWDADHSPSNILGFRGITFQDNFRNIVLLGLNYGTQFDWTASVTKLDSSGRLIWNRPIYDSIPSIRTYEIYDHSFCFTESGYYVCGTQGFGSSYILKRDTSGSIIWNKRYENCRMIESIDTISDKSLIASSAQMPGLRLLKIDSSGNQYWTRDYSLDTMAGSVGAKKIIGIPHNRFALGTSRGQYFARLMIIDSSGNILTSKFYNFSTSYTVYQNSISYCSDSGFVFGGYIRNWSLGEHANQSAYLNNASKFRGGKDIDVFVFKTDKFGNTTSISNQHVVSVSPISARTYPNPTNGSFRLSISSEFVANAKAELIDITGRKIFQWALKLAAGTNDVAIDLPGFVSGVYFLRTEIGERFAMNKVLIVK